MTLPTRALNTASFAYRQAGYPGVNDWGLACRTTRLHFSPPGTYRERVSELLDSVRALGYRDLELWHVHLHQRWATDEHLTVLKDELARRDMRVRAYCGGVGDDEGEVQRGLELMEALNIPLFAGGGGMWVQDPALVVRLYRAAGRRFAYENHPEKTPQELLERVGGDEDVLGVTVDTGWFGTQGYPAEQAVRELAPRLMHLHLKNVREAGQHRTCGFLGGVVDTRAVVQALRDIGYRGVISVEHEPEDSAPDEELRQAGELLDGWLSEQGGPA